MLLNKTNAKQFYKDFRKNNPKPKFAPVEEAVVLNTEPLWWVALLKEQRAKMAAIRKRQPEMTTLFRFVDENGLRYSKMGDYQHRILNPKTHKFVDWWDGKKQTMRRIDGEFDWQGENQMQLLRELANLV